MNIEDKKHVHTSTSIRRYNRCPKLWSFYHVLNLKPPESILEVNEAISIGSCIHECLEVVLKNRITGDNQLELPFHENWKDRLLNYPDHISSITEPIIDVFLDHTTILDELRPIEVEIELYSTMRNAENIPIRIGGKIDAIIEYDNKLWVMDHKSSKRMATQETYDLHQQFNIYCWLAMQHGFNINGIIVNAIRQPSIKKRKNESLKDYGDRIREDLLSRVADRTFSKPPYFKVFRLFKSEETIMSSMEDIRNAIHHMEHDSFFRKNSEGCFKYRRPCEFFDVCRGAVDTQTLAFLDDEHPELRLI